MKSGPLIFLAALFALSTSWFGFVITPQAELGRQLQQTNTVNTTALYPQPRPGQAHQGAEVYRANGCFYCHSQQVGQTGVACDVVLTAVGTNLSEIRGALLQINSDLPKVNEMLGSLPAVILHDVDRHSADAAIKTLKLPDVKTELHIVATGPDIARSWGKRRNVAADYLYDWPVMLGSQRVGPDLANIGARNPDANWHLRHLYAPQSEVPGSTMPSYRFLFEKKKIMHTPSPDALQLTGELAPPIGYEIVPKPEARELVAYLLSLNSDTPLYEAPFSAPPPVTAKANSVAK